MGLLQYLAENWFTLLQSAGIIGSLLFTSLSLRAEIRARRATNLIAITQQHREIWMQLYSKPELSRVLSADVNLQNTPVTLEEELFVGFLILHLSASYHAAREGVFTTPERLRLDIDQFFSLPIPKNVWESAKRMQDSDFVSFVESVLTAAYRAREPERSVAGDNQR